MNEFFPYMIMMIGLCYSNAGKPTYNLYYTDTTGADLSHHCLYLSNVEWSNVDGRISTIEQNIEYCFRPLVKKEDMINEIGISSALTFDQLKKENITSEDLIEWSIPIDLIERYENYLQTNKSSLDEKVFKCIDPWFGPFCQYSFDLNETFYNIVKIQVYWKPLRSHYSKPTCYMHMKCDHYSSLICLDWREICDGKINCINGEDEQNCSQLQLNQCNENEYQCRNGMCVDKIFLLDGAYDLTSQECLDGSDDAREHFNNQCKEVLNFRCEDVAYQDPRRFSCGDGTIFTSIIPREMFHCHNKRDIIYNYAAHWNRKNDTLYPYCFKLYRCTDPDLRLMPFDKICKTFCRNVTDCQKQLLESCPSSLIAPTIPVWDNHVRIGFFLHEKKQGRSHMKPHFACYDQTRCPFLVPTFMVENYTCVQMDLLDVSNANDLISIFASCNRLHPNENEINCSGSNMFHCLRTNQCISHHRIMDGIVDCFDASDESQASKSCELKDKYRFKCTSEDKCLSPILVDDSVHQCKHGEDEHYVTEIIKNIQQLPFSAFCDGWVDMIDSENETDETYCDKQWPCSNQYTRCNDVWSCAKGEDELNCSSKLECPSNHHPCLFPNKLTMDCLHIDYVHDGFVHCIGATDERSYCRLKNTVVGRIGRCWNSEFCYENIDLCRSCLTINNIAQLCQQSDEESLNIIDYIESSMNSVVGKRPFSHRTSHSFPLIQNQSSNDGSDQNETIDIPEQPFYEPMDDRDVWLCNRGILLRVGNERTAGCLCPSNYYDDRCRYQNQRVSLTLRLSRQDFHRLDVIAIVIRLIDHTGYIHSYDQITFIPALDCDKKFNLYLLYQTRPKDPTKNYTIDIDAYDKINLTYLTSWTLSIPFLFMPVNRVSAQLTIPTEQNCHLICNHKYAESLKQNDLGLCHCDLNRSHAISKIREECNCSPDSICVGFAINRSICLCPLNKTGPRCYIKTICRTETCQNGGVCVPYNVRSAFDDFMCVCPEGYSGEYCEQKDVSIHISFSDVEMSHSLLLHYITVSDDYLAILSPKLPRATMFKKLPYHLNTIHVYMPLPFHLLFVQLLDSYYLILLQHDYIPSANVSTQISPSHYCPHIRELFDQETLKYSMLHRVTNYHVPCRNRPDLICFHDQEIFMCLCTEERHANCFHFDFNMTYDCQGQNQCENKAKCYQDHQRCPTMTMCVCPECYYGSKCQFYTKYFGLTLDSIIGYHIYPDRSINEQSVSVKISLAVVKLMLIFTLITGILSIWTFQSRVCQETGCGMYLYTSSIVSILTIVILNLKVWFLILCQMNVIILRGFLLFNCITMDFLLRFSLVLIDWLYACVAIERLLIVWLAVNFNKTKSKKAAKRVIIIIIILIALSLIHDPIHRRILDDSEEKRSWCLARYTPIVTIYNRIIDIIHFVAPFSINLFSAIGIIALTAKQRVVGKSRDTPINRLKQQFYQHKHLLLSSILLVVLTLPRLIISLLPHCMKSPREYKLYLAGYFISFIPPLLIFFIFVLTSSTFKKECYSQIARKWKLAKDVFSISS